MSGPGPGGRRAGRGGRRHRGGPTGRLVPGHGPGEAGLDPGVPGAAGQGFSPSCWGQSACDPSSVPVTSRAEEGDVGPTPQRGGG